MKTPTAVAAFVAAGTIALTGTVLPANSAGILPAPRPKPTTTASSAFQAGPSLAPACAGITIKPDQEAADIVAAVPNGTTFCFTVGLHRIHRTIHPKADQVLASAQGAVLTGSVRLTNWSVSDGDWVARGVLPSAYGRSGQCEDNVANICYLREQVFVDGKHLTRVAARDKVVPGTFYADYAANAVYVGDNPAGRVVEMSKTSTAIQSSAKGVTVRGLTIEHFATPPQGGAVVLGPGWKVYANDIRWNHAVGAMLVNADGAVLKRNLIRYNGQLGVGQYSTVNGTIAQNLVGGNNTDGFWIADWESGGIKIRYEIGRNGVIENNVISGNGFGTGRGSGASLWDGGGIDVNTSSNVTVRNNVVANNVNGISIQSRTRGSGPWGLNLLRDIVVYGNQVTMRTGSAATGMVQNSAAAIPPGEVTFNSNTYILDSVNTKRFQKTGRWYTAREWPQTGQDTKSTFTTVLPAR